MMTLTNMAIIESILEAAMLAARRRAILEDILSEGLEELKEKVQKLFCEIEAIA